MIEIKSISKSFQDTPIIQDLSWTIPTGSIFGLIGPNGAGKSTLLRCLANIYQIDQGIITIDGIDSHQVIEANKKIFYVSDDPFFLKGSCLADMKQFYQIFYHCFDEAYYHRLLTLFKLDEHTLLSSFSKGMKRQAALVLALSLHPAYLLLDESFDGLDPYVRLIFKQLLAQELTDRQLTVIIASHNLREIEDIADSIGVINQGQMLLSQTVETIHSDYEKLQFATETSFNPNIFDSIRPLYLDTVGKVTTLVVHRHQKEAMAIIKSLQPLFIESLTLSLEELFVYQLNQEAPYVTL